MLKNEFRFHSAYRIKYPRTNFYFRLMLLTNRPGDRNASNSGRVKEDKVDTWRKLPSGYSRVPSVVVVILEEDMAGGLVGGR